MQKLCPPEGGIYNRALGKKIGTKLEKKFKNTFIISSISKLAFQCFSWIQKICLYAQDRAKKLTGPPKSNKNAKNLF